MDLSHIHLAVTRLTGLIHTSFLSSNSFYFIERRKVTNSVTKITIFSHGGKLDFFLLNVLYLIHLLEQKFCPDSNLRVKTMYESVRRVNSVLFRQALQESV